MQILQHLWETIAGCSNRTLPALTMVLPLTGLNNDKSEALVFISMSVVCDRLIPNLVHVFMEKIQNTW